MKLTPSVVCLTSFYLFPINALYCCHSDLSFKNMLMRIPCIALSTALHSTQNEPNKCLWTSRFSTTPFLPMGLHIHGLKGCWSLTRLRHPSHPSCYFHHPFFWPPFRHLPISPSLHPYLPPSLPSLLPSFLAFSLPRSFFPPSLLFFLFLFL